MEDEKQASVDDLFVHKEDTFRDMLDNKVQSQKSSTESSNLSARSEISQ